jgi:hypothetical protein
LRPTHLLSLSIIALLISCNTQPASNSRQVQVTSYAPIEFAFPSDWNKNPEKHNFDLQYMSVDGQMNTGVFAFQKADLALDSSAANIFEDQITNLGSKRNNFELFEPRETFEDAEKRLTTATYKGDLGNSRYCYRFTLVEFLDDTSNFAVVLQITTPGKWRASKPVFEAITKSARALPGRE